MVSDDDRMCDDDMESCYFWVKGMRRDRDYNLMFTQVCAEDDDDGDCVILSGDMYNFKIAADATTG